MEGNAFAAEAGQTTADYTDGADGLHLLMLMILLLILILPF